MVLQLVEKEGGMSTANKDSWYVLELLGKNGGATIVWEEM